MNRRALRLLNIPILCMAALIAIALQTSVFSISLLRFLEPQSCLLILIWFALRRGFTEGGIVSLLLGHFMELHSGAPRGFFLGIFVLLFLGIRALDRYTVFSNLRNLLWLTFGTTVVFEVANSLLLRWLDPLPPMGVLREVGRFVLLVLEALPRGAATALMGNWVYGWIQNLDRYSFANEIGGHGSSSAIGIDGENNAPWDPRMEESG